MQLIWERNGTGEFFFIVDSDDTLPENSIERIIFWFTTLKVNKKSLQVLEA